MTIPILNAGGRRRPDPIRFDPEDVERSRGTFASVRLLSRPPSRMCRAALECALAGLRIFPCDPVTEKPLIPKWWKRASCDINQIVKWWYENPNAAIGFASGRHNGMFAICLDGERGYTSFCSLWEQRSNQQSDLQGVLFQGTPYGVIHFFFEYQPGVAIRTSHEELAPGIDVSGYDIDGNPTGYVILAPSAPCEDPRKSRYRLRRVGGYLLERTGAAEPPRIFDLRGSGLQPADPWLLMLCMFSLGERQALAMAAGIRRPRDFSYPSQPQAWRIEGAGCCAGFSPLWAPHTRRDDELKQDALPRISKLGSVHE